MTETLLILAISAAAFVSGRIRSDLVAVCAALSLVLFGVLTPEEALSGFSNPIVVMMAGLFVVGGGIFSTGLAKKAGARILGMAGNSETRLFVLLMLTTGFVGAFVSNTGTVALLLPIVVSMARAAGLQASRFLMPLAFAGSMGGMLTLIGTPPNLVVRDTLAAAGYEAPGFFTFTPIGLVCLAVGIGVLIPLSRIFLSGSKGKTYVTFRGKTLEQLAEEYRLADGLTQLTVAKGSRAVGRNVKELEVNTRYGVRVIAIQRTRQERGPLLKKVEQFSVGETPFEADDAVFVTGTAESIRLFALDNGMEISKVNPKRKRLRFYDVGMAEILLLPTSGIDGKTVEAVGFRQKFGVNVLGVRRHSHYLLKNIKDIRLHSSDVVLVQGPWENIANLSSDSSDWVVLGQPLETARRVTLDYKAPLAALIMLAMVVTMAVDAIPIAPVTAVMLAAVLMILTGCIRNVEEAYRSINWESIILFGAMLPMSTALEKTGASTVISQGLVNAVGGGSPHLLLAAIYLVTSLLTFFISNTVTAVLMAPIALAASTGLGVSAVPMLMGVTVAASMCFASPFSTPPNALVMSAGGYTPMDYVKVGLPLQVIMGVVMVLVLPLLFPF